LLVAIIRKAGFDELAHYFANRQASAAGFIAQALQQILRDANRKCVTHLTAL